MKSDSDIQDNYFDFDSKIQELKSQIEVFQYNPRLVQTPEELESVEQEIGRLVDTLHGLLVGHTLQYSVSTDTLHAEEIKLMGHWPKPMRNAGTETVNVRTRRGVTVPIKLTYYRRKIKLRRGKRYSGVYPGLVLLGIHERCTPALSSEISMLVSALSSLEETKKILLEWGVALNVKTLRTIAYRYVKRAKTVQQISSFSFGETVAHRRVVVAVDGGRVRIRENKRGRKTKKNRHHYNASWREPKLFIVYVVDSNGKAEKSFAPFIDAVMDGPDSIFALLEYYLRQLEINKAEKVLFVSDGARWLWNRYSKLAETLGLKSEQVYELIDFYHAVEHLGEVASFRKWDSNKEKKKWINRQRQMLLKGYVEKVIDAVRKICKGRNGKKIRAQRGYFVKNCKRMEYTKIKGMKLPIGSGAVESAIRRVVNLRLKGASIYWRLENAEAMLTLRSYYKSGRWSLLKSMANSHLSVCAE
jgi:hypothetical protein